MLGLQDGISTNVFDDDDDDDVQSGTIIVFMIGPRY